MQQIASKTSATAAARRESRPEAAGVRFLLGRAATGVLLVVLALAAGRCTPASGETGDVRQSAGAGLKMSVDTRWVDGAGYRPVRVTITPQRPVVADRTLTVEVLVSRFYRPAEDLTVVQDIEIPAGSGPVRATLSVPQMVGWAAYRVNVLEDGKVVRGLGLSGSGQYGFDNQWHDRIPRILIIADALPDTRAIGRLMSVSDYYEYFPGAASGSIDTNSLPTAVARGTNDVPDRWIDYTNLDMVFVSADRLTALARRRPEAFRALVAWTTAGGNLLVYGVGSDWQRVPELESLLELEPGEANRRSPPGARGWSESDRTKFGRRLRGIGSGSSSGPWATMAPMMTALAPAVSPDPPQVTPPPDAPKGPSDFIFREFGAGLLVALSPEDPFPGSEDQWSWVLNTIGSTRWLWYQRHGMSAIRPNPDFWKFLIPGVGRAPVVAFQVLITLFVLGIGPLNYFLLRRWKRLHLLVLTVPLSAGGITLALFGYAVMADGLGTRVRVRSVTHIDQRRGQAACWSRLSFYAGLAPAGGLTFPADVAVVPLEYVPNDRRSRGREMIWEGDQWMVSGWLHSRTPAQFLTIRSRPTRSGLKFLPPDADTDGLGFSNELGAPIHQLLIRAEDGGYYRAANVASGGTTTARPIDPAKAFAQLGRVYREQKLKYPPEMDPSSLPDVSGMGYGPMAWNNDWPQPTARTSRLEAMLRALGTPVGSGAAALKPGSYVAIVEQSPEVVLGTPAAREESSFHCVLGTW